MSQKIIILMIALLSSYQVQALNLDAGLTILKKNQQQLTGFGFNLDLIFGRVGSQIIIGTTKALQKNNSNNLFQSTEMLDIGYRMSNVSVGTFLGGTVNDVEDFFNSWNFSRINYQYGYAFEIFFKLANRWNFGIETRRHIWAKRDRLKNYQTYWLNLNYLFSI